MKSLILSLILGLGSTQAFAGTSDTRLFCSSPDGHYIVSGFLPGMGEEDIRLQVSSGTSVIIFSNEGTEQSAKPSTTATVNLDGHKHTVDIRVKSERQTFTLRAAGPQAAKLRATSNGTAGSFVGTLTGTDPATWEALKAPVTLRCHVTDEI